MYITGQYNNFHNRLHQLCTGQSDLNSYLTEGRGYLASGTGLIAPQISGKWEYEARLRQYSFTNSGICLNTQKF